MERKTKMMSILVALLAAAIISVGCAEVPAPDTTAAQAAYDEAVAAGADTTASAQLAEAKTALDAMNTELAAQAQKAGYSRKYEETQKLLADAVSKANAARDAANTVKEQAKAEAETVKNEVGAVYTQAETTMTAIEACEKKPKNFETVVAPFRTEWETIKTEWAAVNSAFDGGNFADAKTQAEAIKEKVTAFAAAVEAGKGKLKGC